MPGSFNCCTGSPDCCKTSFGKSQADIHILLDGELLYWGWWGARTEVLSSVGKSMGKSLTAYPRAPSRLLCSIKFKYCVPSGVLQFMTVLQIKNTSSYGTILVTYWAYQRAKKWANIHSFHSGPNLDRPQCLCKTASRALVSVKSSP